MPAPRLPHLVLVFALGVGTPAVLMPDRAQAAALDASVVATRSTSDWDRPSPDPAGIAYDRSTGQLIISDSEVNETPLYAGTNLFLSSLDGRQPAGFPGGTTLPHTDEPTGLGLNETNRTLFVSDDDDDRIYLFRPGGDGDHGTGDDSVSSFSTRGVGNGDPEGVAVDLDVSDDGHVFVVDGANEEVWDYSPGPNGRFDGTPPGGDDVVTSFDVRQYGARDPEGIEYHPGRDTLLVLDGRTQQILELDRAGALLHTYSIAAAGAVKAAGMALAPASDGSGAEHLYVVDRGVDNNVDPAENDGRFFELAVPFPPLGGGGPGPNEPPVADAGPDVTVEQPGAATLAGSVTDDGLPDPPGTVTAAWSQVSGPGTATFADASAASTTATFSAIGSYVLALTADDGAEQASDEVTVTVTEEASPPPPPPPGSQVLDVAVSRGKDDAEQRPGRSTALGNGDLELVQDRSWNQTVGVRFAGVELPPGATVNAAWLQFEAASTDSGPVDLLVEGEASDDAGSFSSAEDSVSARPRTSASVSWSPGPWTSVGDRGIEQRTANLAAVVQEIVDRPGWAQGNAMAFVVTGTGTRTAYSYNGSRTGAPVLHVEWTGGDGGGGGGGGGGGEEPPPPPPPPTGSGELDVAVSRGKDDAEQRPGRDTALGNGDLELVQDRSWNQTVGVRFAGVELPPGATVTAAWLQFEAASTDDGPVDLLVEGEASDDAGSFSTAPDSVSARPRTSASVSWAPGPWVSVGDRGAEQRTGDLSAVVQEIVDRPGWAQGNAMAFVVTGTGTRTAFSYNGSRTGAPVLHVEWTG